MENLINTNTGLNRRKLFKAGLALAGGSMLASVANAHEKDFKPVITNTLKGRRKLGGTLEVSSVGLGVQNMSRTYGTTIPTRSKMINIILKVFDDGVTLFDTAEAYGPFECERILDEAVQSFRNKIVIKINLVGHRPQDRSIYALSYNYSESQ